MPNDITELLAKLVAICVGLAVLAFLTSIVCDYFRTVPKSQSAERVL